jgi:hypothetical protein
MNDTRGVSSEVHLFELFVIICLLTASLDAISLGACGVAIILEYNFNIASSLSVKLSVKYFGVSVKLSVASVKPSITTV